MSVKVYLVKRPNGHDGVPGGYTIRNRNEKAYSLPKKESVRFCIA